LFTLFPDWLDANRRGELTDTQRHNLGNLAASNRRSTLTMALPFAAIGLLIVFSASPRASIVMRGAFAAGALGIAAILVVRAITGADGLTRDLRNPRVESVEGAVGRRRVPGQRTARSTYYIEVGDASFRIGRSTYEAMPEAGFVRLYYLPLSRHVVNIEQLPDAPVPPEVTMRDLAPSFKAAMGFGDQREVNEARARIAGVGHAMEAAFTPSAPPAAEARDSRPLSEAIVGTWSNAMVSVTFSTDGTFDAHVFGTTRSGRWSVDADGRLRAALTGGEASVDAFVAGDQLTVTFEGRGVTLTRESTGRR
jgi:hypothetical protein